VDGGIRLQSRACEPPHDRRDPAQLVRHGRSHRLLNPSRTRMRRASFARAKFLQDFVTPFRLWRPGTFPCGQTQLRGVQAPKRERVAFAAISDISSPECLKALDSDERTSNARDRLAAETSGHRIGGRRYRHHAPNRLYTALYACGSTCTVVKRRGRAGLSNDARRAAVT